MTQRDIREGAEHSQMFVKRYLKVLVDYEYIRVSGGGKRGTRQSYRLAADEDIHLLDISMIPTPEEMARRLKDKDL